MATGSREPQTVFDVLSNEARVEHATFSIRDHEGNADASRLLRLVDMRAATLDALGVRRGDRVLVAADNAVRTVVDMFAVMRLGAIVAPVNSEATPVEQRAYVQVTQPRLVVSGKTGAWGGVTCVGPEVLSQSVAETALPPVPRGNERALILFTSGTTGMPKAAVHLHRTLIYAGEGLAHWLRLRSDDVLLLCMPLFHANGIFYSLMGGLCARATINIAPRFSVSRFWDMARVANATEVNLLGPMLRMLLREPARPDDRDHQLRLVYTAAASQQTLAEFEARFGVTVVEGYGMTETPYGCINPLDGYRPMSVGLPRQHPGRAFRNELRIVAADGEEMSDGDVGEIEIRNGAMLEEYWGNTEATVAVFRDGWLRTGDLGYRDADGYVYIIGRSKEVVRRKGVNIAPAEIEGLLLEIPGVTGAALVGLPSDLGDERAVAVVTVEEASKTNGVEEVILAQIRGLISREKWPDEVIVVDMLPGTPTHRVEKGVLKEWLQDRRTKRDPVAPR